MPLTHIEALDLDVLPQHLIVIGGGYAGLELAQAYRRFGAEVTVVEGGTQLMGREDPDASQEIRQVLTYEGISIHVGAQLLKVEGQSGNAVSVTLQTTSGEQIINGSHVLVAAGRIPNTAGVGLDAVGVELDDRGFVRVDERLETSAPTSGPWAIAPAARCSPTYPKTIFVSFATICREGGAARTTDLFSIACSLIHHWRVWA
jgi:pyruvate/2-oxoglutarate dehydrogenase complex dihydrolipoamide dehydrogenase (E3) component